MKQQTNNTTEYQQTDIGMIPKEWEVVRLGDWEIYDFRFNDFRLRDFRFGDLRFRDFEI